MDAHTRMGLSKECFNRLLAWQEALHKAHTYLKVDQYIWQNLPTLQTHSCNYVHDGQNCYANVALTSSSALSQSAIILTFQIFSTGRAGPSFAGNRHPDIEQIRQEMKEYVQTHLGWSDSKYQEFYCLISDQRNQLVAHYDGDFAEYHEPVPGVAAMKLVGGNFNREEQDQLEKLISAMLTFVKSKIFPQNSAV